jgi:hypothetical protein
MPGCEVYANGDEIACKAGDGKVIAAFPDVCLTPPTPPAGPIPVPYADTSFSKDMKEGSTTVRIKGQEVMLKDLSFYKSSPLGNEAATKNLGAGVVTHVITGKTYFVAWSMDVKIEGQNVDRHTDLTTSNHASPMANASVPMLNAAFMAPSGDVQAGKCECCGKRHAGQQGGVKVTEDQWYGLDEGPEIDRGIRQLHNHPPHPRNAKAVKEWQGALADLVARDQKLQARKAAVQRARESNCKSLPEEPCDVYYVFPQRPADTEKKLSTTVRRSQEIEDEWNAHRNKYKRNRPRLASGEKINHRTPKAAGGCPTGNGNLVPDSRLSAECLAADQDLSAAQSNAADRWQAGLR